MTTHKYTSTFISIVFYFKYLKVNISLSLSPSRWANTNNSFINLLFSLNIPFCSQLLFSLFSCILYIVSISLSFSASCYPCAWQFRVLFFRCANTVVPMIATQTPYTPTQQSELDAVNFLETTNTCMSFLVVSHCLWFINYSFYAWVDACVKCICM